MFDKLPCMCPDGRTEYLKAGFIANHNNAKTLNNPVVQMQRSDRRKSVSWVGGLLVDDQHRFLFLRRGPDASFKLLWETPGGKPKQGESLRQTLAREVREETNCRAVRPRPIGTSTSRANVRGKRVSIVRMMYLARPAGKLRLGSEHDRSKWMSITQAKKHKLAPGIGSIIFSKETKQLIDDYLRTEPS